MAKLDYRHKCIFNTIKLLTENIVSDVDLGKGFLAVTSNAQVTQGENKVNCKLHLWIHQLTQHSSRENYLSGNRSIKVNQTEKVGGKTARKEKKPEQHTQEMCVNIK